MKSNVRLNRKGRSGHFNLQIMGTMALIMAILAYFIARPIHGMASKWEFLNTWDDRWVRLVSFMAAVICAGIILTVIFIALAVSITYFQGRSWKKNIARHEAKTSDKAPPPIDNLL